MKPIRTWIILANAENARGLLHSGPGKGLEELPHLHWQAPEPPAYSDEAGVTQSSAGPGRASITRPDTRHIAEAAFAKTVAQDLERHHRSKDFDRLLLVSAPHMLGALRKALSPALQAAVTGEVDKDLINTPLPDLPAHLARQLPV